MLTERERPSGLGLLVDLVNTRYLPRDDDALVGPRARPWLLEHGARDTRVDEASLARLRRLREGLRQLALANNATHDDTAALDRARTAFSETAVQLRFGGPEEPPQLVAPPGADAAHQVAVEVVGAYLTGRAGHNWGRFKACATAECAYAFLDASRNGSRRWCEMTGCGNRVKNRAWRERHRARRVDRT